MAYIAVLGEAEQGGALQALLEEGGHRVTLVSSVEDLLTSPQSFQLLICHYPKGLRGQELTRLREEIDLPILVLGPAHSEPFVVQALKLGADGCLCEPYSPSELLARVQAYLRRYWEWSPEEARVPPELKGTTVIVHEELKLSPTERRLLECLRQHAGNVVPREELCRHIWGTDAKERYTSLSICVHNLRKKLERDPHHPRYLMTKWGVGYYLSSEFKG